VASPWKSSITIAIIIVVVAIPIIIPVAIFVEAKEAVWWECRWEWHGKKEVH